MAKPRAASPRPHSSSPPDPSATRLFWLAVALGWVPAGLGLVGMVVNLWIGSCILLACYGCFAWSLWKWERWERSSKWRGFRWMTVLVLSAVYFLLIGAQVLREYRKGHHDSEAPLSLSVISCLKTPAREAGAFWIGYSDKYGQPTLSPINIGCYLRVVNREDYPVTVDRCTAEVEVGAVHPILFWKHRWIKMLRISVRSQGVQLYFGSSLGDMARISVTGRDFETNSDSTVRAKDSLDGWVFFEYPRGILIKGKRIRLSVEDDYDHTVSDKSNSVGSGEDSKRSALHGAWLDVMPGKVDLRSYRVKMYSDK
jgi:hypothetical protein